jgi:hypothetical protein
MAPCVGRVARCKFGARRGFGVGGGVMNDAIKRLRDALDGVMEHQWSGDKARMNALQELCFAANEVCEAPPIDVSDAARYRWLRENIKERPMNQKAYAAEIIPDTRLRYDLPVLVSWADYCGQIGLDQAIDYAMAKGGVK